MVAVAVAVAVAVTVAVAVAVAVQCVQACIYACIYACIFAWRLHELGADVQNPFLSKHFTLVCTHVYAKSVGQLALDLQLTIGLGFGNSDARF